MEVKGTPEEKPREAPERLRAWKEMALLKAKMVTNLRK
jgi:hypothetical protein